MKYSMDRGIAWVNNWFKLKPCEFEANMMDWCNAQANLKKESGMVNILVFDLKQMQEYAKLFNLTSYDISENYGVLIVGKLRINWNYIDFRAEIKKVVYKGGRILYVAPESYSQVSGVTYINPSI